MIVTIDGPAGAGKSSVARELAARLGFGFLDTGATYRAVALAALRRGVAEDPAAVEQVARDVHIELDGARTLLNGEDISDEIRTPEVTAKVYVAADNPGVRKLLVDLQRRIAAGRDYVTEGRDQGSVVFPAAECKIFLNATPEERARRRQQELADRGDSVTLEEVLAAQIARDERDAAREVGPLVCPPDADELLTDGLAQEAVVARLEELVRQRLSRR